jgi:hypothetical protein
LSATFLSAVKFRCKISSLFTRVVQKPRSREGLGLDPYSRAYSSALYPFYSVSGRTNGAGLRPFNFAETKKNCEERKTAFYAYFLFEGEPGARGSLRAPKKNPRSCLVRPNCKPPKSCCCKKKRSLQKFQLSLQQRERFYSFFLSVLYFSRDAAHGIILIIITDYERRYLCV